MIMMYEYRVFLVFFTLPPPYIKYCTRTSVQYSAYCTVYEKSLYLFCLIHSDIVPSQHILIVQHAVVSPYEQERCTEQNVFLLLF